MSGIDDDSGDVLRSEFEWDACDLGAVVRAGGAVVRLMHRVDDSIVRGTESVSCGQVAFFASTGDVVMYRCGTKFIGMGLALLVPLKVYRALE